MQFKLILLSVLAAGGPAAAVNLGRPEAEALDTAADRLEAREETTCIYDDVRCRRGAGSCGLQCCSSSAVCGKTGNKCRTGVFYADCS